MTVPVFHDLDDTPAYTENSSAVVLDADATIVDPDPGAFDGATLTLARSGGANPDDIYRGHGRIPEREPGHRRGGRDRHLFGRGRRADHHVQRRCRRHDREPGAAGADLRERERGAPGVSDDQLCVRQWRAGERQHHGRHHVVERCPDGRRTDRGVVLPARVPRHRAVARHRPRRRWRDAVRRDRRYRRQQSAGRRCALGRHRRDRHLGGLQRAGPAR